MPSPGPSDRPARSGLAARRSSASCSCTGLRPLSVSAERGVVLIWAAVSVMLIAGLIFAAQDRLESVADLTEAEFSSFGQAHAIAHAGLTDGIAWLRRNTTQPVTEFTPARDPSLPPPGSELPPPTEQLVNETEDPSVGIVRTFEISPGIWGRYAVIRGHPAEAFDDANGDGIYQEGETFTDANGDERWTPGAWTRDVSAERGIAGSGSVWYLACRGEAFRRPSASEPLGEGHNTRIAEAVLATEVRRLTIAPPASATVVASRGDGVTVGLRARLRGDTCIAYASDTGTPATSGGEVLGSTAPVPELSVSIEGIFGVTWTELKSMADISTNDPAGGVPAVLPDYSLTVVTGDITFDRDRPLQGSGVVVVKGNVVIESGSNSFFRGVLVVDGHLTARAPAFVRGTIMVTGDADLRGMGGDFCEIEHDPAIVSLLLTHMGQYRQSKAPFAPQRRLEDGRPSDLGISRRRWGGAP